MTPSPSTLPDILRRVEEATGPDRALDVEIALATCSELQRASTAFGLGVVWSPTPNEPGSFDIAEVDTFTASVDAALALIERSHPETLDHLGPGFKGLPATVVALVQFYSGKWSARITDVMSGAVKTATCDTPALALLAALLRSLEDA